MKRTLSFIALLSTASLSLAAPDCQTVSEQTAHAIETSPEKLLQTVAQQIAANESCAGEVVKTAILTSKADKELVAQIVETAAATAPKQLQRIADTAIAFAPDAYAEIAAVLKRIDLNQGTAQGRGRKVSPIDFPGGKIVPFRGVPSERAVQLWTGGNGEGVTPPPVTE
jgi:hypothetical protein